MGKTKHSENSNKNIVLEGNPNVMHIDITLSNGKNEKKSKKNKNSGTSDQLCVSEDKSFASFYNSVNERVLEIFQLFNETDDVNNQMTAKKNNISSPRINQDYYEELTGKLRLLKDILQNMRNISAQNLRKYNKQKQKKKKLRLQLQQVSAEKNNFEIELANYKKKYEERMLEVFELVNETVDVNNHMTGEKNSKSSPHINQDYYEELTGKLCVLKDILQNMRNISAQNLRKYNKQKRKKEKLRLQLQQVFAEKNNFEIELANFKEKYDALKDSSKINYCNRSEKAIQVQIEREQESCISISNEANLDADTSKNNSCCHSINVTSIDNFEVISNNLTSDNLHNSKTDTVCQTLSSKSVESPSDDNIECSQSPNQDNIDSDNLEKTPNDDVLLDTSCDIIEITPIDNVIEIHPNGDVIQTILQEKVCKETYEVEDNTCDTSIENCDVVENNNQSRIAEKNCDNPRPKRSLENANHINESSSKKLASNSTDSRKTYICPFSLKCHEKFSSNEALTSHLIKHAHLPRRQNSGLLGPTPDSVIINENMNIPENMMGFMIGKRGERIKSLGARFGCHIFVPLINPSGSMHQLSLTGPPSAIKKAKEHINHIIDKRRCLFDSSYKPIGCVLRKVKIPSSKVGLIIGRNRKTIKKLEESANVLLRFQRAQKKLVLKNAILRIVGKLENIEAAIKMIVSIIGDDLEILNESKKKSSDKETIAALKRYETLNLNNRVSNLKELSLKKSQEKATSATSAEPPKNASETATLSSIEQVHLKVPNNTGIPQETSQNNARKNSVTELKKKINASKSPKTVREKTIDEYTTELTEYVKNHSYRIVWDANSKSNLLDFTVTEDQRHSLIGENADDGHGNSKDVIFETVTQRKSKEPLVVIVLSDGEENTN